MQDEPELVSVVIPTYNRADLVRRAVESVRKQDYDTWEVIVVDDASTDDTARVISQLQQADSRIRLLVQPDRAGAQAARNAGVRASRGEWIAFLDSDDYLLSHSLARRLDAARRTGAGFVHSEGLVLRPGSADPLPFGVGAIEGDGLDALLRGPGPMFQGMLVRRAVLEKAGPLDEKVRAWQEWDTAIRLAGLTRMAFVREPTFVYDCTREDSDFRAGPSAARGYARIIWKYLPSIARRAGPEALVTHFRTVADLNRESGRRARWAAYNLLAAAAALLAPRRIAKRIQRTMRELRGSPGRRQS